MFKKAVSASIVMLLVASLFLTFLPSGVIAASSPPAHVFISEGAEEATYAEWNAQWERFDANSLADSDWWCRSTHETHASAHAIYCARNGYNSHYLNETGAQPWDTNITGLASTSPVSNFVYRYDTGQDSIMRKAIVGAQYYGNVTMSFEFWSQTGVSDAAQPGSNTPVGYDFLNAIYYTGSGSNLVKHVLWTDSYEQATSEKWIQVNISVPNTATMVGFEFVSGTKAPTGGDAANAFSGIRVVNGGMLEGVYLDTISVTGTDPVPNIPLVTSVDALAPVQNNHYFTVSFTHNDPFVNAVPVNFSYVNLYYRLGDSGPWTKYTSASHPDGAFGATNNPISFLAAEDGLYEFFTQGFDDKGVAEPMRNASDAATTTDTLAPLTTINIGGTRLASGDYSSSISFSLASQDAGSGVNTTYYKIDGSSWVRYEGSSVSITSAGTHEIQYYSTDLAGNTEVNRTNGVKIIGSTTPRTDDPTTPGGDPTQPSNETAAIITDGSGPLWIGAGIVGVVAVVAVVVLYRRRT
jgi:hypothetical protein